MAVTKMKKLSAVVPKADAKKLIRELQKLSCVEIKKAEVDAPPVKSGAETSRLEALLAESKRAVEYMTEYTLGKGFSVDAPHVSLEDFESGLDIITEEEVYKTNKLCEDIAALKRKILEVKTKIDAFSPWKELQVELPYHQTSKTVSFAGTFPSNTSFEMITRDLGDLPYTVTTVSACKEFTSVLVSAHRSAEAEVKKVILSAGFSLFSLSATEDEGYAIGVISQLEKKLEKYEDKLSSLIATAKKQSERIIDFKALCDLCETRIEREKAYSHLCETAKTCIISGWVPYFRCSDVEALLGECGCAWEMDDPEEGDDVPTLLSNNVYSRNFETIISMYSLPHYGEFDPTWIMSIFYTIIFGMMFADVGYGLVVLLGCIGALKLMHPKEGMKKMLRMFALSAISCIFFGVMFGGYFGDLPQAILTGFMGYENAASPALIFDMIENPIAMLILSLAIGVIHIVCAMLIKMYILICEGDIFGAIFDVGSWLVLFAGIGIYFLNSTAGLIVAIVGAAMLILTQGRHQKNIIMKIVKGIMSLYDIISYASDLLSYSRILALSLSSAVIAMVVNLLATMVGFSPVGIIAFLIIFTLGHGINFALNLLSAYIHSSRLQYLEFFGKFYEGGGREFEPISIKSNRVNLK